MAVFLHSGLKFDHVYELSVVGFLLRYDMLAIVPRFSPPFDEFSAAVLRFYFGHKILPHISADSDWFCTAPKIFGQRMDYGTTEKATVCGLIYSQLCSD